MEKWYPEYETLSRLDESSLFLIGNRLKRFLDGFSAYEPLTWPVNCFALTGDLCHTHGLRLTVTESSRFSGAFDAAAVYDPAEDRYLLVRRKRPEGWQSRSRWRRCNFTVAHELGHIFLDHLAIPEELKSEARKAREDAEADEFASRLLMPEALMRAARFPSLPAMAEAFLVSEQACFHRLNNLRLLDRVNRAPACPECGSRRISPCASWCRMCGASLGERIPDETARMMPLPWRKLCPVCGSGVPATADGECPDCGYPRDNPCQAEYDQPRHANEPDARFCEFCGAETLYRSLADSPGIPRELPLWKMFHTPPEQLHRP